MAANSQISATNHRSRGAGRPFVKGHSGNPRGRPKSDFEIQALAREYTIPAIQALAKALGEPRYRVAAATVLLGYGYGRPKSANDVMLPGEGDDDKTITIKFVHVETSSVTGANGTPRMIPIPPPANDDD